MNAEQASDKADVRCRAEHKRERCALSPGHTGVHEVESHLFAWADESTPRDEPLTPSPKSK